MLSEIEVIQLSDLIFIFFSHYYAVKKTILDKGNSFKVAFVQSPLSAARAVVLFDWLRIPNNSLSLQMAKGKEHRLEQVKVGFTNVRSHQV